jgi:ribosomal protein L24
VIKEGDYVVVVSGKYGLTTPGSWGRVRVLVNTDHSVLVKFEFITTPHVTGDEFVIQSIDLAPLTKLHKLLYRIEHV